MTTRRFALPFAAVIAASIVFASLRARADQPWVVYDGFDGPGKGKHIVLISGDQEYRSEEALPQLARILAKHHGFKCTVLFTVNPKDGTINPNSNDIPGLEALKSADLMVIFLRFCDLPDDQMKHIADYLATARPIVGLRTSTHAFNIKKGKTYERYSFNSSEWKGGFGKQILGETWVNHHGGHGSEATRGLFAKGEESHPILRGIKDGDIFGPTDVYTVNLPLPGDCKPLVMGQVVAGMKPTDKAVEGKKNDPMMPVAWTRTYSAPGEQKESRVGRVFSTTMGALQDLETEGTRRMLVNACYWAVGLEGKIPEKSNVAIVGEFKPTPFRMNGFKKGVKPSDYDLK